MSERCCFDVGKGYHVTLCANPGKVQVDGKWYCGVHDPIKKAAKQAATNAKWAAERALENKIGDRKALKMKLADAAIAYVKTKESGDSSLPA